MLSSAKWPATVKHTIVRLGGTVPCLVWKTLFSTLFTYISYYQLIECTFCTQACQLFCCFLQKTQTLKLYNAGSGITWDTMLYRV